jgi:ketosteroid isomerase-like protein
LVAFLAGIREPWWQDARMKTCSAFRIVPLFFISVALGASARAELTAAQANAFTRDFYSDYNAQNASKLANFYTADATFTDPTFGLDLRGRKQIGNLLSTVLTKYDSLDHIILHQIIAGDDLVIEGMMAARLSGKDLSIRFVSVFHFTNGKISDQRDMYDVFHLFTQLGVVPAEFRPKPAAKAP